MNDERWEVHRRWRKEKEKKVEITCAANMWIGAEKTLCLLVEEVVLVQGVSEVNLSKRVKSSGNLL